MESARKVLWGVQKTDGSFIVEQGRFAELSERVRKLNRKAVKLGMAPIEFVELEPAFFAYLPKESNEASARVGVAHHITLSGQAPVIAGHTFIATIEHLGEANLVKHVPGRTDDLPESFRTAKATCEHCKLSRRRADTFVLRNEAGTFVRVGRQCLQDFLRTAEVQDALRFFTMLDAVIDFAGCDDFEYGSGGARGPAYFTRSQVLGIAARIVREGGWVSRAAAENIGARSSGEIVRECCGPQPNHPTAGAAWEAAQPLDVDIARAAAVLAWLESQKGARGLSDYIHNLVTLAAQPFVESKHVPMLASAVVAYSTHVARELERSGQPNSAHVGIVGKRQVFELEVTRKNYKEGEWGTTTILGLRDDAGNDFTWFASTGAGKFEPGDKVTGKGTVKAHSEYKGRKQTVLTRCAFEKKAS